MIGATTALVRQIATQGGAPVVVCESALQAAVTVTDAPSYRVTIVPGLAPLTEVRAAGSTAWIRTDNAPAGSLEAAEPIAAMQRVIATTEGRAPGLGEAAHHLRRHLGYPPAQARQALQRVFAPAPLTDYWIDLADVRKYADAGRRRAAHGARCRFCGELC